MAARISVLGIGNDVGGSVRVPATYCGIASLKVS
jgi:Asp-tRNA(Asn)/Glu-tRNA(Gln) amidotransferase A subunit family amidase